MRAGSTAVWCYARCMRCALLRVWYAACVFEVEEGQVRAAPGRSIADVSTAYPVGAYAISVPHIP
eukprot:279466-Rhodomonas_salina.4